MPSQLIRSSTGSVTLISRLVLLEQWGPVVGPLTAIHHKAVIAALER
jgi:hypothetical protein